MSEQITHDQVLNVRYVDTARPVEEVRRRPPDAQMRLAGEVAGEESILLAIRYDPDPLEVCYGFTLPAELVRKYAMLAAKRAQALATAELLEDGSYRLRWYAEIRGFPGVQLRCSGTSKEEVIREIEGVVLDWTLLKIQDKDRDLPIIDEINLNVL